MKIHYSKVNLCQLTGVTTNNFVKEYYLITEDTNVLSKSKIFYIN